MNPVVTLVLYGIVMVGLSLLFMNLSWRQRGRREREEYETLKRTHPERVFGTPEYLARFDHPDIVAVEAYLGRTLPAALRTLYSDSGAVRGETEVAIQPTTPGSAELRRTLHFFPADRLAIDDLWPVDDLDTNQIPFAADSEGGMYFLELQGEDERDPPVYRVDFDEGDCRRVCDSLTQFLSCRKS